MQENIIDKSIHCIWNKVHSSERVKWAYDFKINILKKNKKIKLTFLIPKFYISTRAEGGYFSL